MLGTTDTLQSLFWVKHLRYFICVYIIKDIIIQTLDQFSNMLDLVRPKLTIPDDSKIKINEYRNPYLSKLTIKLLPNYTQINGPTLINPLQSHNNVAITQSLPLWRNEKFRINLIWQQNIRNTFNRSHIGFLAEYQINRNYGIKTRNLIGSSFLTTNEFSKSFVNSGKLITASVFHSCFFQSVSENYHSVGGGLCFDNRFTVALNKRIGAQTSFKAHYERPIKNDLYLRVKYDTEIQNFEESAAEVGVGYYWSRSSSFWLRTAVESMKVQPNLAVQLEYRKQGNHSFLASIQYRNNKSILYVGYKCPTFNFIFPIYGTDSVIPALIGIGAYIFGYFKRSKHEQKHQQNKEKDRYDELKLISDKANENYKKQQALKGLLIQQVYIGEKNLLQIFLKENNRHIKLIRDEDYSNRIYDGTISFRFYVQKGELHIPKGKKLKMIGLFFREEEDQEIQIYIRYSKRGKQHQKTFKVNDQIKL